METIHQRHRSVLQSRVLETLHATPPNLTDQNNVDNHNNEDKLVTLQRHMCNDDSLYYKEHL